MTSATVLKETSLMGVGALGSFVGCRCPWCAFKVILHLLLFTATTKIALQLPVSLTVQQFLWHLDAQTP